MVSAADPVHDNHHSFLSWKRLKVSDIEHRNFISNTSEGVYADFTTSVQPSEEGCSGQGFADTSQVSSSGCNFDDKLHSRSVTEMSCRSNGSSGDIQQTSSTGGTSYLDQRYYGYAPPATVNGWMYINEQGQMCGPYIQHQLYEGLSTGFLPEELPVYPVVNGALINPVPLKYFKQFPDYVATGFAYLNVGSLRLGALAQHSTPINVFPDSQLVSQSLVNTNNYISKSNQLISNSEASTCVTSFLSGSAEDACWWFEDARARKRGPHSLLELFSWN